MDSLMERVGFSPRLVDRLEKKALGIQDSFTMIGAVKQIEYSAIKARRGTENKILEAGSGGAKPYLLSPVRTDELLSRNAIGSKSVKTVEPQTEMASENHRKLL